MPRGLFYAGVVASALIGVLALIYAFAAFAPGAKGPGLALGGNPATPMFFIAVLICIFPAAAIFVRIASLISIRNVHDAFFAIVALACTMITVCLLAIGSLRLAVRPQKLEVVDSLRPLVEIHLASYYALGLFLSVLLLAVRPWFRVQASGLFSGALVLPSILFGWIFVEEHLIAPVTTLSAAYGSAASFAFFVTIGGIFFGLAAHCASHQPYFTEVTNLRDLLEQQGRGAAIGGFSFR